jgi:hypothetical protein
LLFATLIFVFFTELTLRRLTFLHELLTELPATIAPVKPVLTRLKKSKKQAKTLPSSQLDEITVAIAPALPNNTPKLPHDFLSTPIPTILTHS